MSDSPSSSDAQAALARQRHFIISVMRLMGVVLVMLGIAVSMEKLPGLQGDVARYAGLIISAAGLLDFAVVPRMLARRWASPHDEP